MDNFVGPNGVRLGGAPLYCVVKGIHIAKTRSKVKSDCVIMILCTCTACKQLAEFMCVHVISSVS